MEIIMEKSESIKLFIADNDENIISSISRNIRSRFGDMIDFSTDPDKALEKIAVTDPDIVITDINFGKGEAVKNNEMLTAGVTLARKIRTEHPDIKIIAISGYRNNDSVFEKITEKDWYDVFHTKGGDDLYDKYSELRRSVINKKTGLIPYLSRFFAPLNHNWEPEKSIYRIMHTNYDRNENLKYLPEIKDYFNTFKKMLQKENEEFLENIFNIYRARDLTNEERSEIKSRFHIKTNNLEFLFDQIRSTIYAESALLKEIWDKMISETKDHGDIHSAVFKTEFPDHSVVFSIAQQNEFDFDGFIESSRTLNLYKKIANYGDVFIRSGNINFSSVSGKFGKNNKDIDGTVLELILKI